MIGRRLPWTDTDQMRRDKEEKGRPARQQRAKKTAKRPARRRRTTMQVFSLFSV